jgi:hypothetical protein
MGQGLPLLLKPIFHGFHAIRTGDDQPVKGVPFSQSIVEGTPVIRRTDLQSRQIENLGTEGFQQSAAFTLLLHRSGHHHGASQQRRDLISGHCALPSNFTIPLTRS